MTLTQILDAKLQEQRKAGKTNKEMAELAGCSQQHMNDLLNHKKNVKIETLKFGTILRLFPQIQQVLEDYFTQHQGGSSVSVNGNGSAAAVNGNATAAPVTLTDVHLEDKRDTILDDDGICDACKVRVLKILKG